MKTAMQQLQKQDEQNIPTIQHFYRYPRTYTIAFAPLHVHLIPHLSVRLLEQRELDIGYMMDHMRPSLFSSSKHQRGALIVLSSSIASIARRDSTSPVPYD